MILEVSGRSGRVAYTARCIPPGDLRFGALYSRSLNEDNETKEALWHSLRALGATRAYAPFVSTMNAEAVSPSVLDGGCPGCEPGECVPLCGDGRHGIALYRNSRRPAETLPLEEAGVAAIFPLGGCAICVAYGRNVFLVAHAGQRSLIDPSFFEDKRCAKRTSVVETMARTARFLGVDPEDMYFEVMFALPGHAYTHDLDHPEHGQQNRRLLEFAREYGSRAVREREGKIEVDVAQLAVERAEQFRFRKVRKLHGLPVAGEFAHTRHPDPAMRTKRNAAILVRTL